MSQAAITLAFEKFKAQEAAGGRTLILDEFVLANVPGLDPSAPIDRNEGMPPAGQIVHRQAVNTTGVVNEHAVAYSITMGTEVGDFDFNWLGLVNKATGLLAMVVHVPTQRKIANAAGQQGNALTRSFLMEFDGAAAATGITTPAETWQIDFTARLHGMDEMQRLANRDLYGAGAFFGDGFLVVRQGAGYTATAGIGYIGGLRGELTGNKPLSIGSKPTKVWADVSLQGNVTSVWETVVALTVAETMVDYVDQGGFAHYVFAVASIDAAGTVTDLRPKGSTTDQASQEAAQKLRDDLDAHVRSRNHPDATLADKGFVRLYSGVDSNDETKAATPKAVKVAMDNANGRLSKTGGTVTGNVTVVGRVTTDSFTDKKTHIGQDYLSYITLSDWAKPIGTSEMCKPNSSGVPNGFTGGYWHVLGRRDAAGGYAGLLCGYDTANLWFGFNSVGNLSPEFARIYTERYKPTPGAIGALDKNQNGADIPNKPSFIDNIGLRGTVNLAAGALQKGQNGADIPDKDKFTKTIGAGRALHGSLSTGAGNWTTAQLIDWLESQGAFNHPYWMCKCSWSYGNNRLITDTGCGNIHLAGAVIEVMGIRSAMTIRVTTPTTSSGGGTGNAQFTYINHGSDYSPGWRRDYNTRNPQPSFALGQTGSIVDNDKAVPWNAPSGVYEARVNGGTCLILHFNMGRGSCPSVQFKVSNRNGGIYYRSSRDGYGFESDWEKITNVTPPQVNADAIGSLALLRNDGPNTSYGAVVSGSYLYPASAAGLSPSSPRPGNWRCLGAGYGSGSNNAERTTLFVRVS
ncbi:phage tail protein [Edwardsiella tarda]|uniref:phage tail-collar fiber domain-containing protein n=1 Tax=Edwardsiella tarda TaxID=636 RepID=UPI001E3ED240|nr:phage tail protein [Edwardsiella tarda]